MLKKTQIAVLATAFFWTGGAMGRVLSPAGVDGTLPLATVALTGDGTLPLGLPSEGTLPLRLQGAAMATSSSEGASLATQLTITNVDRAPLPSEQGGRGATLACQLIGPHVTRHEARGSLSVGDSVYTVNGLCFDHAASTLEVVATNAANVRSNLIGTAPGSELRAFAGRLVIVGPSAWAGHYLFDLKGP